MKVTCEVPETPLDGLRDGDGHELGPFRVVFAPPVPGTPRAPRPRRDRKRAEAALEGGPDLLP